MKKNYDRERNAWGKLVGRIMIILDSVYAVFEPSLAPEIQEFLKLLIWILGWSGRAERSLTLPLTVTLCSPVPG